MPPFSLQIVEAVAERLEAMADAPSGRPLLVVDPVLVATSGDALAAGGVMEAMRERLLPGATIVTPNIPEASALLGGQLEDSKSSAAHCKLMASGRPCAKARSRELAPPS